MSTDTNIKKSPLISRYRPEIDGLRAFAVIAVIINHFNKSILPGGYLGVDIFFVISGFVITSSLYQRPSKNLKDFITGFYERRLKRLVPALSVFVLISSATICFFNPSPSLSLKTGIASLFGLSNLYLFKQSTDYFAQTTELNVFTHTWSLGVEEQFYILFPFLIWFSGFGRQTKNGPRNLFLIIGILAIASLIGFLYLYPNNQSAAYFLMPTRFWEMAVGCLIFIGFNKRKSIEQFLEKIPPFLVLALIIGIMYLPMSWATASTVAVVVLSSVLIASLKNKTLAYKFFTNHKVVYIGLISYSLYLWHWGVLSISRWTIGIHWWSVPFQVILMFGLAVASYQIIETPIRKRKWFEKRWKTLSIGGGILITLSGGLIALEKPLKGKIYLGKAKESKCNPYQYETCSSVDAPHEAVTPFIKGTKIQRNECFRYKGPITNVVMNLCKVEPEKKSLPTIFVTGSSYSHHFSPIFEELRNEFGIGLSIITKSECDLDPLLIFGSLDCQNSNKNRISYIKNNAKEGDILFASVTHSKKFDQNSVNEIIKIARKKNMQVVHLTPIPKWERLNTGVDQLCRDGSEIEWFRPKGIINCSTYSKISRKVYKTKANNNEVLESLKIIEQSNENFHVFPIHNFLCDSSFCPSHINGIRLYRDNFGHISLNGAKQYIGPELRSFLIQRKLIKKNPEIFESKESSSIQKI